MPQFSPYRKKNTIQLNFFKETRITEDTLQNGSVCIIWEVTFPNIKLGHCQSCSEKQDEVAANESLCQNCLILHTWKGNSLVDMEREESSANFRTAHLHEFICTHLNTGLF